jgi:hypothetical protein
MALTYSELQSVSKNYFDKRIHNDMYQDSPFFARMKKQDRINYDGGIQIQFPIKYLQLGRSQEVGPREQVVFGSKDTRTAAILDWAYYMGDTTLHWDEKVKNAGQGKIIDLAKDKAKELKDDLAHKLAYNFITATSQGTNTLIPLAVIVDAADSYGGIAVADASDWKSIEDSTTTTMTLFGTGSLSYQFNAATFGKDHPSMFLTTRDLLSKLESLLQPQVRYTSDDELDKKFPNVMFNGYPAFSDAYTPSGYFYGIDEGMFEMVIKDGEDTVSDWFSLEQAGRPKTLAKWASWVGNIKCNCRKTSFKMSALDYTK